MKASFLASEIPAGGVTAGDLKMAEAPTEPTPPPVQGPTRPVTPEEILTDIYKRLDQQGTLLVQIADRIIAPQNPTQQAGGQQVSVMGIPLGNIGDLINAIRGAVGNGGGSEDLYNRIGHQVVDKTLESTVRKLIGSTSSEAVRHVSG